MIYANTCSESFQYDTNLDMVETSGLFDCSGSEEAIAHELSTFVGWYFKCDAFGNGVEDKLKFIKALLLEDEDITPEFLRNVLNEAEKLYE